MMRLGTGGRPVDQLFEQLAEDLCREARRDPTTDLSGRLWRLARVVAHGYGRVITREEKAAARPDVERLRQRAVEIVNSRAEGARALEALSVGIWRAAGAITFRRWGAADVAFLVAHLSDEELWRFLPEEYPGRIDGEVAAALIRHANEAVDRHEVRAVLWKGRGVGQVRLQFDSTDDPGAAEISYWLARPFWGMGLGSSIVQLYTAESFRRHRRLERIFARVLDGNVGSLRVLERARYRRDELRYRALVKAGAHRSIHELVVFRSDYPIAAPTSESEATSAAAPSGVAPRWWDESPVVTAPTAEELRA